MNQLQWTAKNLKIFVLESPQLDEALDFNGNIFYGAIGNACIGCTAWQKSFNVMARWSLTLAFMGQWFCWAPWAFEASIDTVRNARSAPHVHQSRTTLHVGEPRQLHRCIASTPCPAVTQK